jgi:hypothetical protein
VAAVPSGFSLSPLMMIIIIIIILKCLILLRCNEFKFGGPQVRTPVARMVSIRCSMYSFWHLVTVGFSWGGGVWSETESTRYVGH